MTGERLYAVDAHGSFLQSALVLAVVEDKRYASGRVGIGRRYYLEKTLWHSYPVVAYRFGNAVGQHGAGYDYNCAVALRPCAALLLKSLPCARIKRFHLRTDVGHVK